MEITITKSDRGGKTVITEVYKDAEADKIEKILSGQSITPESRVEALLKKGGGGSSSGGSGGGGTTDPDDEYESIPISELEDLYKP